MTLRQKLVTVLISLSISLVMAFALGELVMRLHVPAGMRLRNNQIILPRNQVYSYSHVNLRGCDTTIIHHKNSLGFRGPELPVDFKDRLSVIAVGGSTTECFYLSDGHSWPELLGHKLQRDIPRIWMNNAGLDGHSTFGHIILVRDILSQLHPKVILFLVGVNDMGRDDLAPLDHTILKNPDAPFWQRAGRFLGEKSLMMAWIENAIRAYAAWKRGLGHQSLDLEKLPALGVLEPAAEAVLHRHQTLYINAYHDRLLTLIRLCRQAQIRPVFITQPSLYGIGHDDITNVNLETIQVAPDMNGRLAWRVLELYNDMTRRTAQSEHMILIDLAHQLPKSSRNFYDFYHFTNAGAEATARIIEQGLRPVIEKGQFNE